MSYLLRWLVVLSFFPVAPVVFAESQEDIQAIQKIFTKKLPHISVTGIQDTPLNGVYQVEVQGGEIVHVTADAQYLIAGDLFKLEEPSGLKNLTDEYRGHERTKLISTLDPTEEVIFSPKGEAKGKVYVFTDVDCGYCRKFHNEVPKLNALGIEVRYLAWPRAGLSSTTGKTMTSIWCSENRQEAMSSAKQGQSIPQKQCTTPIQAQIQLGYQLGVRGTPAIFLEDGRKVGGYRPAEELAAELGI